MKSLESIIPVFALLFTLLLFFLLKKFNTTVTRGLLIFTRTKGFIFDQRLSKGLLGRSRDVYTGCPATYKDVS